MASEAPDFREEYASVCDELDRAQQRIAELEAALKCDSREYLRMKEERDELEAELAERKERYARVHARQEKTIADWRVLYDDLQRRIDSAPPYDTVEGTQSDGQPVSVACIDGDVYEYWYNTDGPGRDEERSEDFADDNGQ